MATMTTTITLTPTQSAQVNEFIAEGRFASPQEAVEQLLSSVLEEEEVAAYTPQVLAQLRQGMAEADRGEFVPKEETAAFFDDWKRNG